MGWRAELETALSALISSMAGFGQELAESTIERRRQNATDVLCRHPALEKLLKTSDQLYLRSLVTIFSHNTAELKSELINRLVATANRTNIEEAVRICDKVLTDAEKQNLPGFDLTSFVGLKLTKRWDIAPGLYAIPYESIQQELGQRQVCSYEPAMFELNPKGEKSLTVLVRELRWGPIIISSAGSTTKDPGPVKTIPTCDHDPILLIALLAVTLNCPLSVVANTRRAATWVDDFLNQLDAGGSYFDTGNRINSRRGVEVSVENERCAEQVLKDWETLADGDRDALALAITHLSTSLSRGGLLAQQDRVLDISIALEILYRLDRDEIAYKLSTRAGWYLGSDASERLRIRKTLSDFYGFRSAIVHGRHDNKSARNREIYGQAFDIARKTLLKHLAKGSVPSDQQWNETVMGQVNANKH